MEVTEFPIYHYQIFYYTTFSFLTSTLAKHLITLVLLYLNMTSLELLFSHIIFIFMTIPLCGLFLIKVVLFLKAIAAINLSCEVLRRFAGIDGCCRNSKHVCA